MRVSIKIFFGLLLSGPFLLAYATPIPMPVSQGDCSVNSAYNAGLNDGLTPHMLMDFDYAGDYTQCTTHQAELNEAYKRGFIAGLPSRPKQVNKTVVTYPDGSTRTYN